MINTNLDILTAEATTETGALTQDVTLEYLAPERYEDLPKGMLLTGRIDKGFFYFTHKGRPARLPERFVKRGKDDRTNESTD